MPKQCSKCGETKPLEDFTKDKRLLSGRSARCKKCNRKHAHLLRKNKPNKVKAYKKKYSDNNKNKIYESINRYYINNLHKRKAHAAVKRALANGKLQRLPCCVCGSTDNIQAHHEDYNKPLDIVWLCRKHHSELHRK